MAKGQNPSIPPDQKMSQGVKCFNNLKKFKASNKKDNFPSQFPVGRLSNKFDYVDSKEIS